jgi:hypothetical protein
MARVAESRLIERLFLDRIGDHRGRLAGADQRHGTLDRRDDGRGVCRIGPARFRRDRQFLRQNRQGPGKHSLGLGRLGDGGDGNVEAQTFGQGTQARWIVDSKVAAGRCLPGRKREFAADSGRFAHGQCEWPQGSNTNDLWYYRPALDRPGHSLILTSMLALRRRSRI